MTLYANGSGGLIERMGATGADVIGLDWTVDMADARRRLGSDIAVQVWVPSRMPSACACARLFAARHLAPSRHAAAGGGV